MPLVLIATPGASNANSFLTLAEALVYFEGRLEIPEWEDADSQEALLVMATCLISSMFSPLRKLVRGKTPNESYYLLRPTWTGAVATATQSLPWPRTGMYDRNGYAIADIAIVSNSIANPTVVTTAVPHRLVTGGSVVISGVVDSSPDINGAQIVTVISETTFSIPVNVTVAGTGGTLATLPRDLKNATAEFAAHLAKSDRSFDNDVALQGITSVRAGSVAVSFKDTGIDVTVIIPDVVWNLLVPSWLTDEIIEYANRATFEVIV